MPLTVLTDADVNAVLFGLTRDDVLHLHRSLGDALHSYSTATTSEQSGCCSSNQPERISVKSKDGSTTLFMPATSDHAKGVKIVTIAESSSSSDGTTSPPDIHALSLSDRTDTGSSLSSVLSTSSSGRTASPSRTPSSPSLSRISFADPPSPTASASPSRNRGSIYRRSSGTLRDSTTKESAGASTSPQGSITLLDARGNPRALLNASTLTGFRTALASTMMLKARESAHTITCFGAGVQAFWHLYLSFLLRGSEIHHLHIINRSFDRARTLITSLAGCLNPRVSSLFSPTSRLQPDILTPSFGEYSRLLKEHVRAADIIYMTTPSTSPLFPGSFLTNAGAHNKGRYIAAIGSYKPHMHEIPIEVIHQAVRGPHRHHGIHHKYATEGGAVVVDTIDGAFKEAGEIIESGISGDNVVEIGELVMLIKDGKVKEGPGGSTARVWGEDRDGKKSSSRPSSRASSRERERHDKNAGLISWMERGNVVYKSVGLGLMDVVVGMEIVRLAEERGVGTIIQDF